MATGKIVPKEEIEIKPNIAGIIDKILVKEGDKSRSRTADCYRKIVPSISEVNAAQQEVQNAQIQISNAQMNVGNMQKQFEMQDKLYKQGESLLNRSI